MRPCLLAIDNGSQSSKVTIFDARGHALASASRRLRPYDISVPGRAVHPGDDIWDSIQYACREVMAQFPGDPADIVAVGLCTIRFCRALLTADGSLAEPVLSWMDERVARPYEPARPPGPLRHHVLRLHHPPPDRPVHRHRRQLRGRLAHRPRHRGLVGRSRRLRRHRHAA